MKNFYYDLTENINKDLVAYPEDPIFSWDEIQSIKNGDKFNLCHLHIGNHTGTHIDFPAHVIKNGKTSSDFSIEHLIGDGLIIDLTNEREPINEDMLKKNLTNIKEMNFVFFKTFNSISGVKTNFSENYIYMKLDAAKFLIKNGVKIVGIDYLSIDSFYDENLTVHKEFLKNEVFIVENLKLNEIDSGKYRFYILPLKLEKMDGLPVRVIAEKILENKT